MTSDFDAIVLAGGTAERLGGAPKHAVVVDGRSLLDHTLAAVGGAGQIVLVGDPAVLEPVAGRAVVVREDPPLSGPAAGIGAGLDLVSAPTAVVLACDHPHVADAVGPLLSGVVADGSIAVDAEGRRQNLLLAVRTEALRRAVRGHHRLAGLAVHALLESLDLQEVAVPARALLDVDTWEDRDNLDAGGSHA